MPEPLEDWTQFNLTEAYAVATIAEVAASAAARACCSRRRSSARCSLPARSSGLGVTVDTRGT